MKKSFFTKEYVETHNKKVNMFVKRITPFIESLSDAQCKEITDFMSHWGNGANSAARMFREKYNGPWSEEEDVAVGLRIVPYAFERLDLYDIDFRPKKGF